MAGDHSGGMKHLGPRAALVRAAPRLSAVALAATVAAFSVAGGVSGIAEPVLTGLWLALAAVAVPSSPKRWWRYVKHGRPPTWRVTHGGTTRLFVTDPGHHQVSVAACLREHGPLDLGEAVRRLDDPTRPVWDDLTADSADRLGALLEHAGAAVVVDQRP
jgi:hypothetical protein